MLDARTMMKMRSAIDLVERDARDAQYRATRRENNDLAAENERLRDLGDEWFYYAKKLEKIVKNNNEFCHKTNHGIVVAGYTGNPAHEIAVYKAQLICEHTGISKNGISSEMPREAFIFSPQVPRLSEAQQKELNLRLLCRMEWIDWCMHVQVMSNFAGLLAEAFLNPTDANKPMRNRAFVQGFTRENRIYHAMRTEAMDVTKSERVRSNFEDARYKYWVSRIGYEHSKKYNDNGYLCPTTRATRALCPTQPLDLHLPAGRLARDHGISLATGKPSAYFREELASSQPFGHDNDIMGQWFYNHF